MDFARGEKNVEDRGRILKERQTQSLRTVAETLNIARETAHMVSAQSESLDRSERIIEETQHAVDLSKRIVRGMTWSGWIYNKLSSPPTMEREAKRPEKIAMGFICPDCKVIFNSAEELSTHFSKSHETTSNRPNSAPSGNIYTTTGTAPISVPSKGNRESKTMNERQISSSYDAIIDHNSEFLRELEPQLAELKEASLSLGNSLVSQNHQLERLDWKIDQLKDDMKKVSLDAKHVGGKKLSLIFRFRCALQETKSRKFLQDVDGEPLISADAVVEGCSYRAYTLGDGNEIWGLQSEKSSLFLGINRFGYLKLKGSDLNSYEQLAMDHERGDTPLFCYASFFGTGGWIMIKEEERGSLTMIRGTPENKPLAARFKIVNLDLIEDELKRSR